MKASKHTNPPKAKEMKDTCAFDKMPANMLLGLATATTCSALAVKFLKKGELALLMTLMSIPVTMIRLNRTNKNLRCKY